MSVSVMSQTFLKFWLVSLSILSFGVETAHSLQEAPQPGPLRTVGVNCACEPPNVIRPPDTDCRAICSRASRSTSNDPSYPNPGTPSPTELEHQKQLEKERQIAAEAAQKQAELERKKADMLSQFKGTSTTELPFKGMGNDAADDALAQGFKGIGEARKGSNLSEVEHTWWRTVSLPAGCVVAGDITAGAACLVVDGDELWKALHTRDPARAIKELFMENAGEKTIAISFGGGDNLEKKLGLARAIYEALIRVFEGMLVRIDREWRNDPAKRAWLTQYAKLNAAAIAAMRGSVFAEVRLNLARSLSYLRENPSAPGIQFNCGSACHQLIEAVRGTGTL